MSKLNHGGYEKMAQLQQRSDQLTAQSKPLRDRIANFVARRPYTKFTYVDPVPNFDSKRIHGPICRLIKMKNPETSYALEIAAGGRVFLIYINLIQNVS